MRTIPRRLRLLVLATLALGVARAFIVNNPRERYVPVERLLANAERARREAPAAAEPHYRIARLHYYVFSTGLTLDWGDQGSAARDDPAQLAWYRRQRAEELAREDVDELMHRIPAHKKHAFDAAFARRLRQLEQSHWTPARSLAPAVMARHAATAMEEIEQVMRLEPTAHAALFRASLAEQFLRWQREMNVRDMPDVFRELSEARVREFYLEAFRRGYEAAKAATKKCSGFEDAVTREAGEAVLRLTEKAPRADAVRTARDEVEQKLETMRSWPQDEVVQLISPIVFSLGGERRIAALLDPATRVDFDLRGFGPRRCWSWLKPTTALLVWDPARTGVIASGRQLFGNFTFQIEWAAGYHALAALDDDGDGWLRGAELSGVRAWFDRDGDGRSAPDEVMDLSACGIVAIAVHATGREGVHPTNPQGVLMADGSASPSWDWMTEPIRD